MLTFAPQIIFLFSQRTFNKAVKKSAESAKSA